MEDLVNRMTHDNPASRPRIEEVLERFAVIQESLSQRKLCLPITSRKVPKIFVLFRKVRQFLCTVQ